MTKAIVTIENGKVDETIGEVCVIDWDLIDQVPSQQLLEWVESIQVESIIARLLQSADRRADCWYLVESLDLDGASEMAEARYDSYSVAETWQRSSPHSHLLLTDGDSLVNLR